MQIRIPPPKEIKQKIIDHPTASYFGFLGIVFLASYSVSRTLAKASLESFENQAMDDMYNHMRAGDHLVLTYEDERFHYAPYIPEEAS
jgi:hypothetical protein